MDLRRPITILRYHLRWERTSCYAPGRTERLRRLGRRYRVGGQRLDQRAIVVGFRTTLRTRRIDTSTQRPAWLVLLANVPVGVLGSLLEHPLRTLFAKPLAAGLFLTLNGVELGHR
ncbi:hypothetical protein ACW2Q0_26125 [Nocardia sp. R16R-3T]